MANEFMRFFGSVTSEVFEQMKATAPQGLHGKDCFSLLSEDSALSVQEFCHENGIAYALYSGDFVTLYNPETKISRSIFSDPESGKLLMKMDEAKDPFIRNRLLLWDQWLQSQKPLEVIDG